MLPDLDAIEKAHGLPVGVLEAVIEQESSGNPWAVRFEPSFFARYIDGRSEDELGGTWPSWVSASTEQSFRATSFGLMQVLGQVARELGFKGPFLTQLCDPAIGVEYGARHLAAKFAKYGNLESALSAYNSGSPSDANRKSYVEPILRRMGLMS